MIYLFIFVVQDTSKHPVTHSEENKATPISIALETATTPNHNNKLNIIRALICPIRCGVAPMDQSVRG